MRADDGEDAPDPALSGAGLDKVRAADRPRILSDDGVTHIGPGMDDGIAVEEAPDRVGPALDRSGGFAPAPWPPLLARRVNHGMPPDLGIRLGPMSLTGSSGSRRTHGRGEGCAHGARQVSARRVGPVYSSRAATHRLA